MKAAECLRVPPRMVLNACLSPFPRSFVKHLLNSYYALASLLGAVHSQRAGDC